MKNSIASVLVLSLILVIPSKRCLGEELNLDFGPSKERRELKRSVGEIQDTLSVYPTSVTDRSMVVLRSGETIAMVIIENQRMKPKTGIFDYSWRMRHDGIVDFSDGAIFEEGKISDATSIGFGPFAVRWSAANDGRGYVMFEKESKDLWIGLISDPDLQRINSNFSMVVMVNNEGQNYNFRIVRD